uniref:Proline rich 12 n=1 Tax=Callorhinchus milii TaxID=7868 RepID=A0A4W3HE19_CALMI
MQELFLLRTSVYVYTDLCTSVDVCTSLYVSGFLRVLHLLYVWTRTRRFRRSLRPTDCSVRTDANVKTRDLCTAALRLGWGARACARAPPVCARVRVCAPPVRVGWGWILSYLSVSSLVYGGSRGSHPDTDILHRQAYATAHPLQGYATNHHPAGLSGLFETGLHHTGTAAPDASVMNLISALESRAPQSGPTASSLLSQFRPPHPASFSGRSFPVTSSLTLQDATFSPSSNGLLSPHDPLLHIKSSQASVPSSLTFDRLGSAVLGTGLPSQTSAYRTAQESASRHLQSQFNLLSSPLGPSEQASQLYNTSVFSTSPAASIERAMPRQDSVIKHYQRPSSAQAQLPASHHSLQHYLSCGAGFQQMSRHSSLACSPLGDQSSVSSEGSQQKSSQARSEHSQSYRPIIQSPGYSSSSGSSKSKSYSASRQAQRSTATPKCQSISSSGQSHNYSSSTPKPSSVISSQSQAYSPMNQPQTYSTSQAQNLSSVTQSQGFASSQSQDLTASVSKSQSYQTGQTQGLQSCVSQAQSYSPEQLQGLPSVGPYSVQSEPHSSVSEVQSYVPAHSQGMPPVSSSLSYATGHSPASMSSHGQSIVYSASGHMSDSSPSQIIRPLQSPTGSRSQSVASPGQSQKYLSSVLSPSFIQSSHSQSFQPSQSPLERTPTYGKSKPDSDLLSSERTDDEDFLIQHLLDSQSPPRVSAQSLVECGEDRASKGMVYEMSKTEERYHLQSVIRTNSSLDNQVLEMSLQGLKEKKKGERQKEYGGHGRSSSEALVTSVVHYSHHQQNSQIMLDSSPELQMPMSHQPASQQSQLLQSVLTHTQSQMQAQQRKVQTPMDVHLMESQRLQAEAQSPQLQMLEVHLQSRLERAESGQQVDQQQMDGKDQFSSGSPQSNKQRYLPLTSICFPDSLLQDEERNFFPGMEDMFCSAPCSNVEYSKQGCGEEGGQGMERGDGLKSGYEMIHSNQSFSGFCTPEGGGGGDQQGVHLSLDSVSMKPEMVEAQQVQTEHLEMTSQPNHGPTSADIKSPLTTASFCSLKTKKFLKTSSLLLLKKKESPPQAAKKTYAQEYEFEDEEKEDVPADIRLNNRRLPDLLPDLISSCRTRMDISPVTDIDFCSSGANTNNLNGGKSRSKRASKPKEKGPPRPRGRPRIRPLDAPPQGVAPEAPKKRGRGRGRGKKAAEEESEGFGRRVPLLPLSLTPSFPPSEVLPAESGLDNSQTQEKIKKKIKEVEEKQPEMKSGFMASFLDFLKSGKRQQPPATASSPQKGRPGSVISQPAQVFGMAQSMLSGNLDASESDSLMSCTSPCKRFDEDLKKNLETLPSFSSDEEDSVSKNQDLQKSISSAISALYDPVDRKENDSTGEGPGLETPCRVRPHPPSQGSRHSDRSPNTRLIAGDAGGWAAIGCLVSPARCTVTPHVKGAASKARVIVIILRASVYECALVCGCGCPRLRVC